MQRFFKILICAVFTLGGCGGDATAPSNSQTPAPPPPVVPPPQAAAAPQVKPSRPATSPRKVQPTQDRKQALDPEKVTTNDFLVSIQAQQFEVFDTHPEPERFVVQAPFETSQLTTVTLPESAPAARIQPRELGLRLPAGFIVAPSAVLNERGFPDRILCEGDQKEMVLIDGGVFVRGSNSGAGDHQPEHLAFVDPFYMDVTEVTLAEFYRFEFQLEQLKSNRPTGRVQRSRRDGPDLNTFRRRMPKPKQPVNVAQADSFPALGISFDDAEIYATFFEKSLPTEAEWERAARGPHGDRYPWGNGRPLQSFVTQQIAPVASNNFDVTSSGLFDLAGNAREWTTDWYASDAYAKAATDDGTPVRNPQGPRIAEVLGHRVVRGSHEYWDLWRRDHENIRDSAPDIGFRCVLRITEEMQIERPAATSPRGSSNDTIPPRPRPTAPAETRGF